jgi:GH15 family glucan-1,4-alpha-glucosidase
VKRAGDYTMIGDLHTAAFVNRNGARVLFERLLTTANDVGLFSEEVDVRGGQAIGNIPQAFSHVGAIHAAHALSQCEERR